MNWHCAQTEARLSDYLEHTLTPAEQEAADAHVRACAHCAEWLDARQAVAWLRQLTPLPVPLGLETRILAHTTGLAPRVSFWEVLAGGWHTLAQPRVALSVAAALFSVSLVLQTLDLNLRELSASDFRPANLYRKLDRTAHLAYGRSVKFINDLQVLYEIRSRLDELRPLVAEPAEEKAPAPPPAQEKEEQNFTDDTGGRKFYAYQLTHPAR
ncbi:MAG: zf-HC2 domain-containing protein [Terriglobia bacterium]